MIDSWPLGICCERQFAGNERKIKHVLPSNSFHPRLLKKRNFLRLKKFLISFEAKNSRSTLKWKNKRNEHSFFSTSRLQASLAPIMSFSVHAFTHAFVEEINFIAIFVNTKSRSLLKNLNFLKIYNFLLLSFVMFQRIFKKVLKFK